MGIIVGDVLYHLFYEFKPDLNKDLMANRIAYYPVVFVNFICIVISCKLYKNAIYVAIFLEMFASIFLMYDARKYLKNIENTKA